MPAFDLHIVFDCADPDRVARFWMAALGGYDFPVGVPDGFATWDEWADANGIPVDQRNRGRTLVDTERGTRPDIFFLRVPESKQVKNRVHLDIKVAQGLSADDRRTAIEAEAGRLIELGGSVAERMEDDGFHLIMRDPEGNEFCLA
ncbi:VOC family protein [Kribbella turkmenica]|uniref:VOC family protein n=1 Tax=Kribbella turkmenica TaxID=2530375 RepID=A0A4R4XIF2_9ACTN|nr:VOC family protein [Kribbella turkmenica]TDD30282.1 VOC family protein [Kribbella turkmenica]